MLLSPKAYYPVTSTVSVYLFEFEREPGGDIFAVHKLGNDNKIRRTLVKKRGKELYFLSGGNRVYLSDLRKMV